MIKFIFIFLGTLSLVLGILGIFIPGLPTTPLLLLSSYLYFKSSTKLYNWLLSNKYLGKYIKNYRKQKGMTLKQKIYAMSLMWIMILLSVFIFISEFWGKIIVICAGLTGTIVMGFIVKTVNNSNNEE